MCVFSWRASQVALSCAAFHPLSRRSCSEHWGRSPWTPADLTASRVRCPWLRCFLGREEVSRLQTLDGANACGRHDVRWQSDSTERREDVPGCPAAGRQRFVKRVRNRGGHRKCARPRGLAGLRRGGRCVSKLRIPIRRKLLKPLLVLRLSPGGGPLGEVVGLSVTF